MKKLTAEWVSKAEVDYRGARKLAASHPPMHDLVCFCCQQTAEKYLKTLVEEQGLTVPWTHDLEDLLGLLIATYPMLLSLRRGCKFLIQFAVEARYPGFHAKRRQAQSALRWSERGGPNAARCSASSRYGGRRSNRCRGRSFFRRRRGKV